MQWFVYQYVELIVPEKCMNPVALKYVFIIPLRLIVKHLKGKPLIFISRPSHLVAAGSRLVFSPRVAPNIEIDIAKGTQIF